MMGKVEESTAIFSTLTDYFTDLGTSVSTGSAPPAVTPISELEFTELFTFTTEQSLEGAGTDIGASQESIFTAAAAQRELNVTRQSKFNIYLSIAGDYSTEAEFYTQNKGYFPGVISGAPSDGSQS